MPFRRAIAGIAEKVEAVHHRHVDVGENGVDRIGRRGRIAFRAVAGFKDFQSRAAQRHGDHLPYRGRSSDCKDGLAHTLYPS